MTLSAGTRLGPYEILSPLGARGRPTSSRSCSRGRRCGWRSRAGSCRSEDRVLLRPRWSPDGLTLAFPEKGDLGIAAQDFTPGKDTSATRRLLTGLTPDSLTESLGVAPDGARLTVSELQDSASLLLAEGVEGVVARTARGAKQP